MKKIINLTFLITILALSSLKANAVVLTNANVKSIIVKQVLENTKKYTDAELSVEVITLPFKDLTLPDGEVSFTVKPSADKFMPRDLEKVSVYVNGKFAKTFNAPVVVKAWENVLVASCPISRERQITPDVVRIKRVEVSNSIGFQLKIDSLTKEMVAKKGFMQGEVIDKRFVKQKPDILRNANVTVFFNNNNLTVTVEATALTDGVVGDSICLMNRTYNKVYTGKVIGENKVLVKI